MFRRWDLIYGDGDAIDLSIFPDESWWTVYAAHLLEHIADPVSALREWYRVLHPDGRLIVNVPSMELYEGQTYLPSRWNADHRTFWMPEFVEPGQPKHIRGLRQTIMEALPSAVILDLRVLNEGHLWPSPEEHPLGEYSIEAIIGKGKK
jgi:predicted SAM-dependent methyltransferase